MVTYNNAESTTERHEIDPVLKEVLTFDFGRLGLPIQTQIEVSRLPRTIDAGVVLESPGDIEIVSAETAFDYFRIHNFIEFKGESDPLTLWGYRLILGRANLYSGEKKISASEMTVTIISARKPRKVLYHCQDDVRWKQIGAGHYVSTDLLPVHLFVCNELPLDPKYYPLLLFAASKAKFRRFLEQIVSEDNTIYIHYAQRVDYDLTKEVLEMAGKRSKYQENLERFSKEYGPGILRGFTPEERIRGVDPAEILRELDLENLRGLDADTLEKLRQLLNRQGKQN